MAGYDGYRMSNNAVECYDNGIMPYSKWTKNELLNSIENIIYEEKIKISFEFNELEKMPLGFLKEEFLKYDSWHHTSSMYNQTDFYKIDKDYIEKLTNEKLKSNLLLYKKERKKESDAKKTKEENEKSNWYYAKVTYEFWSGTRRHPKLVSGTMDGIVIKGWIHSFNNEKKNIDGKHILEINNLGQRKPRDFDKISCNILKKKLKIK